MTGRRAGELFLPLDLDFDQDEKVLRLARYTKPGEARACRDLLVAMWRYCKRRTSDGHVPLEAVGTMVYPDPPKHGTRDADRLVECGLAERTPDGYYFPSYLKRNPSRAQLRAEYEAKAEAGRKGGRRSGSVRRSKAEAGASSSLNTEAEAETEAQSETGFASVGGEPSPTSSGTKPRCALHKNLPDDDDPPCRGCMKAREDAGRAKKRVKERAAAAVAECEGCDPDGWLLSDDGEPTTFRCDHVWPGRKPA